MPEVVATAGWLLSSLHLNAVSVDVFVLCSQGKQETVVFVLDIAWSTCHAYGIRLFCRCSKSNYYNSKAIDALLVK